VYFEVVDAELRRFEMRRSLFNLLDMETTGRSYILLMLLGIAHWKLLHSPFSQIPAMRAELLVWQMPNSISWSPNIWIPWRYIGGFRKLKLNDQARSFACYVEFGNSNSHSLSRASRACPRCLWIGFHSDVKMRGINERLEELQKTFSAEKIVSFEEAMLSAIWKVRQ
jgi:hypothetical protein